MSDRPSASPTPHPALVFYVFHCGPTAAVTCLPHICTMQDQSSSHPLSETAQFPSDHDEQVANIRFAITPQDSEVLMEYLDEFQGSNTALRTKIIETAMGRLYMLRPVNALFDKVEAREVCLSSMYTIQLLLYDLENTEVVF
jgi:hypothetical protein